MDSKELETLPISRYEFAQQLIFKDVVFESLAGYMLECHTEKVTAGTRLIDPDTLQKQVLIVLNGELEVHIKNKGGSFVSTIPAGNCAGEMSVFDNMNPSAVVMAKVDSRILVIPAKVVKAMLKASHEFCLNFLNILSKRIREGNLTVCEEQYQIHCIEENAKVDTLTGLHNRRWQEEMYTREINRSNMGNFQLTAFMVDIDHFKQVNDTYGHLAGDKVLISVAQSLMASLRPSDMPVRYGGEEFTVFLPGTSIENAKMIAERVRKNVEKQEITFPTGETIRVTVSIGIAERMAGDSVPALIERADQALYFAKSQGRNQSCVKTTDGKDIIVPKN